MPDPVFASTITLDGAPYLRVSAQIEKSNLQMQAAMQQISARVTGLQTAFRPLNAMVAQVNGHFTTLRTGLTGLGASSAPVQTALSQTARALAGLSGGGAQAGLAQMAASLGNIATQAEAAGTAVEGLDTSAQGAAGALAGSEGQEGDDDKKAESPAAESPAKLTAAGSTAVGALAGTRELVEEDEKLEAATKQLRDSMGRFQGAAREAVAPVQGVAKAEGESAEQAKRASREVRDAAVGFRGLGAAAAEAGRLIRDVFVAMPEVAAVVAVFASVGEAASKIREIFSYGDELNALSRQTGETATNLAILRRTFEYFDVSADEVGHTLFMLQRALGGMSEEGEPTGEAFARIGLSVAALKQMDAPAQFAAIQAGLAKLPTQADRANTAMKIFGRSALEVQAVLNADPADFAESMQAATEYAQTIGRNADAFEDIERKFFVFREQIETVFAHIAAGLIPAVQSLLNWVGKIDFSKWGRDIEIALRMITAAFQKGDVGKILELSLTIAFKNAANVLAGMIAAFAAGLETEFSNLPHLLRDAFGILTDRRYWIGIGEMVLGGFLSIQGRLNNIFIHLASTFGVLLEDGVKKMASHVATIAEAVAAGFIPGAGTLIALRQLAQNNPFTVAQRIQKADATGVNWSGVHDEASQGDAMFKAGLANVTAAGKPITGDVLSTLQSTLAAMQDSFKNSKFFDTAADVKKLSDIIKTLVPASDAATSPRPVPDTSTQNALTYKMPDSDRLAKIGLFVGGSPAAAGLSEARRTAIATEATSRGVEHLVNVFRGRPGQTAVVYG